jgi:hypothetical protein
MMVIHYIGQIDVPVAEKIWIQGKPEQAKITPVANLIMDIDEWLRQ